MRQAAEILTSAVKHAQEAERAREDARQKFLEAWRPECLRLIVGTTWARRTGVNGRGTKSWLVSTREATARLQNGVPFDERSYGWGQVLERVQPEYHEIGGRGFELVPGTWIAVNDGNEDRDRFLLHGEVEPFAKDYELRHTKI